MESILQSMHFCLHFASKKLTDFLMSNWESQPEKSRLAFAGQQLNGTGDHI
jgi:hypothetical protein